MILDKFLTFFLDKEEYGLPISNVKEIIGLPNITYIPQMPDFVKGVINLRGKIIPVIDLRIRLGFKEKEYDERTCIIVTEIEKKESKKLIGLVVDNVSEVLKIAEEEMEQPPVYSENEMNKLVLSIANIKTKNKIVILLDATKIFRKSEINEMDFLNEYNQNEFN